ncbi:hypothetical protein Patl1_06064 [Pistacia atlantica]|uniref:Uncharacterized protein n=1 Tax=Pistacia atlantica TaxID=434234 RepID=A0ACC1BUM5_9ROSI|nr:hypothetical protein Patl1_06064 [Pistacia atlantica]
MCRSKRSTDIVSQMPRNSRSSKSSFKSKSSSINDPSSSNFTSNDYTPNSHYNFSSKSSGNSAASTSLKTLRESLPENPHIYDFSEIFSATNNFLSNKFSSSSSSTSWRSSIRGKEVIIFQRKLRRVLELEQLCERLSVICRSHHSSLIKLLGASVSGNYIYLVYEYVSGANLSDCLRNKNNPDFTVLSSWLSRMQVATDLAHGLDYIHHFSGLQSNLIHNHIKSSSIIVSEGDSDSEALCAKFCHFGTAELCGEVMGKNDSKVRKIEGTRGYMSPEFQLSGVATQKSDVYAFGVVMLELVSGDEALRFVFDEGSGAYKRISVIETACEAAAGGGSGVRRWVDRRLRDSYPVEVAEKMVLLGLQCVDEYPEKRPDMRHVAGLVSKLYLESKTWAEKIGLPTDFSVSIAPR